MWTSYSPFGKCPPNRIIAHLFAKQSGAVGVCECEWQGSRGGSEWNDPHGANLVKVNSPQSLRRELD